MDSGGIIIEVDGSYSHVFLDCLHLWDVVLLISIEHFGLLHFGAFPRMIASGCLEMRFFQSFFQRAWMSLNISFPGSLGLSDAESELEELELLPLGGGPRGSTIPPGGLLSLDSIIPPLGIEPLPDRSLHGGGGRSYNESVSSLFRRGMLPHQVCCSRTLSITEVISIPLQDCWAD
jgi:hypothetical protein